MAPGQEPDPGGHHGNGDVPDGASSVGERAQRPAHSPRVYTLAEEVRFGKWGTSHSYWYAFSAQTGTIVAQGASFRGVMRDTRYWAMAMEAAGAP